MTTRDDKYSNWEFYLFYGRFILVGILLALIINVSIISIFNLVVSHDELFVIQFVLILFGTFVLYIILLTLLSDTKKKTLFDTYSKLIPKLIFRIVRKNNKDKSFNTNFLISLGIYEAILIYIGLIFTTWSFFADFYLSITPLNSVLGGTLFFSVPFIFGIIFGVFISNLKWDSDEIEAFITIYFILFIVLAIPMVIEHRLNLGFEYEMNKLVVGIFLFIPFSLGIFFMMIIEKVRKSNKISVPEINYKNNIDQGKSYWNFRFLVKFSFLFFPCFAIALFPERILLSVLGIEKTAQFRHPILALLFAILFLGMLYVIIGFITILSEKPRLFDEHPLKYDVRRVNLVTGNAYHYSPPLFRQESHLEGNDLQLKEEIPKFLIGKKVPCLFFYPMRFSFKRPLRWKLMNICGIPIPSDIRNGEIICLPQLGLKTKNGEDGDLYVRFNIISNVNFFINSLFSFAFAILYLIIFIYVEYFLIESL